MILHKYKTRKKITPLTFQRYKNCTKTLENCPIEWEPVRVSALSGKLPVKRSRFRSFAK